MSLGRLLESAEGQRNTASSDTTEFFSRRLRENERTVVTLILRIEEAFPNEVGVISDLNELVFVMNELSRDSERSTFTASSSLNDRLSAVARNGLVGRPRLQILQEQLQTLYIDAGFRWADIGRILGISERTLRRRRHEFGLPVGVGEDFSDVSNDDLDECVREILEVTPNAVRRLVEGGLKQRGLRIQRYRIQQSIRGVDPLVSTLRAAQQIIRRVYSVPCPNALWLSQRIRYLVTLSPFKGFSFLTDPPPPPPIITRPLFTKQSDTPGATAPVKRPPYKWTWVLVLPFRVKGYSFATS